MFMEQQRRYHRMEKMAKVLGVSRGGCYAWCERKASKPTHENKELVATICDIQETLGLRREHSYHPTTQ